MPPDGEEAVFTDAILLAGGCNMPYKYTFLVTTMALHPETAELTADEINDGFTERLGGLAPSMSQYIQQAPEGPWEAISHSLTRLDNNLVITLMLRAEANAS